ncbi:MAG: OmpA family protein, partial [Ignavibacterium sp.]
MSNGDQNKVDVIFRDVFGTGKSSALTSKKNELILKFVKVSVLEMEDVLFHLNSCVLMPENPKGKSSKDGNLQSGDESLDITGIKALAVVFKQFEFDPDVRMIVTGHTDTSGTPEFNFTLSDERAQNVLYLLIGKREEWAELSYNRHKVEDYQQIMKYFEPKLNCGCDPGEINDKYNDA